MPNQVIHREQPMTPAVIEQTVYVSSTGFETKHGDPREPLEQDIVETAVAIAGMDFWEARLDTLTAVIIPIFTGYLVQLVHIVWNWNNEPVVGDARESVTSEGE